jgi:hypothetical protein
MPSRSQSADTADAPRIGWLTAFREQWYRPERLLPAALLLTVLFTWPYLLRWAPDLSRELAYQMTPQRLHLPPAHRWVPGDFADRVLARAERWAAAQGRTPLSLLHPALTECLARSLLAEAWVEGVHQVHQHRDGTVRVELVWRRPALMVATSRGMYAVDRHAVLLPPEDFSAADVAKFPLAVGVATWPQGGAGEPWGDPALLGAARLAALLAPRLDADDPWEQWGLATIVLPALARDGGEPSAVREPYRLMTRGGVEILWGDPPGVETLEPRTEEKLARLELHLKRSGGVERPHEVIRIDLREREAWQAEGGRGQRR